MRTNKLIRVRLSVITLVEVYIRTTLSGLGFGVRVKVRESSHNPLVVLLEVLKSVLLLLLCRINLP